MSSWRILNGLFLVLLVFQTLPFTQAQNQVSRALIAAAGLSLITFNYAGVTEWSAPQLVTIALVTAILLRRQSFYCDDYPTFTYDTTYDICYRTYVQPEVNVQGADAVCKAHGAQLIRIDSPAIYDFVVKQINQNGISNIYFQGKRAISGGPFLYDDGSPVTYFNWVPGEPLYDSDLYLRTDTSTKLMETSDGDLDRSFICAAYPN